MYSQGMHSPVEEIKERLNIVDVIQEYTQLKKAGSNHKGLCPFHNERTPSFTVSEQKQFFHCFGCAKGGDVFTFIQDVEGVEFAEALRILAAKAHVELKEVNQQEQNERTRLLDCLSTAAAFFHTALYESKEGEIARRYLEERGIQKETAQLFQLGYSPDSWDMTMSTLKKKGFTDKEIEKAGLSILSNKTQGHYDRFRKRLMFPIYNTHGNVIGFTARTLDANQKEAKYINTPQTAIYNKSETLYGIHLAKKYIQKMNAAMIVEGNMDVVSAHQAKFRNVVASSGTALTEEQVRMLKRYSENVILAFDADSAGIAAAFRGMRVAIQQGMNIKVAQLPEGKDPDDILRENPQEFRDMAVVAKPFMDYVIDSAAASRDLSNVQDKKQIAAEILPMIALLPDPIEQTHYIQQVSKMLNVPERVLQDKVQKNPVDQSHNRPKSIAEEPKQEQPQQGRSPHLQVFERVFAILAQFPQYTGEVLKVLHIEQIEDPETQDLYKKIQTLYNQQRRFDPQQLQIPKEDLQKRWNSIMMRGEEMYADFSTDQIQIELRTLIENLTRLHIHSRLTSVERELSTAESNNDSAAIERLSEELYSLTESLRNFQ